MSRDSARGPYVLELNDKLFVALAKKAGFPSREALKKGKAEQGDRSLFETVRDQGELSPEQAKKLERWAKQIRRGDLSPLEGNEPSKASGSSPDAAATGSTAKAKTPSAGKVKTASADPEGKTPSRTKVAGSKTASAGKTAAASADGDKESEARTPSTVGKGVPKRRKMRQSSMQMPVVAESPTAVAEPDEGTKDVERAPGGRTPSTGRTATAKRARPGSTPSGKGVETGAPAPASSKGLLAIAAAALFASACIGGAVAMNVGVSKVEPAKVTIADSRTGAVSGKSNGVAEVKPTAVAVVVGSGAPRGGALEDERVARALSTASQLERESKEDEAILALDATLETATGDARSQLIEAKNQLISRLRDQIDRAKALAGAGKLDDARKLLASLRGHFPEALTSDLDAADRYVQLRATKGAGDSDKGDAPDAPAKPVVKPTKPAKVDGADAGKPAAVDPEARRADELARLGAARPAVSKALVELDIAGARAALEALGSVADPEAIAAVALERKRIDAVAKLLTFAGTGFRVMAATNANADVELRDATHVVGKVASADAAKVVIATKAAGEVPVALDSLSIECLLRTALLAAADEQELYFFGRGVLLLCAGDRTGALDAFAQAPTVPESAALMTALKTHDSSFTAPGVGGGATGEKKKPEAGPVVLGPDGEDLNKPHVKTWMDDTEGGVPWEKAVDYNSKFYVLHTNVKKEYALRYLKLLDAIALRYMTIFDFHGNDFAYNKNMVLLYRTQESS